MERLVRTSTLPSRCWSSRPRAHAVPDNLQIRKAVLSDRVVLHARAALVRGLSALLCIPLLFAMHITAEAADPLSEAFVNDAGFNAGYLIDDRFATSYVYDNFYARKVARLSNGDVVVAGLVPAAYQVDQGNGQFNIGLVRYGPSGERVPWPAPTPAYISFYDRYLQYPNNYSHYDRIADVRVINGFIYVLADYLLSSTDRYPHFIVFGENGNYVGIYSAGTLLYESGVGMVSFVSGGVRKLFSVNQTSVVLSAPGMATASKATCV